MTIRSRLGASARGTPRVPPAAASGSQGAQGAQGRQGFQGAQGAQGFQGAIGPGGGAQGAQGATGVQGFQGAQGFQGGGFQGATGAQGFQGATGVQGFQGAQGFQGSQGFQGPTGIVALANIYLTGQNAAIGVTNVFSSLPAKALYRISAFLDVVTAGTAGTLATRINFTPDDGVSNFGIVTSAYNVAVVGASSGEIIIETDGVAQVTYEVDAVGLTAGALNYSLRIVGERIS